MITSKVCSVANLNVSRNDQFISEYNYSQPVSLPRNRVPGVIAANASGLLV